EAGQQQPQRIPLLGSQSLAVLSIHEQRILQHLFNRDAARHHRGAPSASTQAEPSLRPTSRAIVANCTPVHSVVLSRPCVPCTVFNVGLFHSVRPFPEHSMKCLRVTEGNRLRSAIENFFGEPTMPWTTSE